MNKPVIIIIFSVVAGIFLFLFAIPEYRQYHHFQSIILEKQAQYSGESIYFARISDILAGLESRKEVLDKIQSALPADVSVAPVVDFLQKKGTESGVSVTSVVFSQVSPLALGEIASPESPNEIQDILFTLNATGSYQGLKNFLSAMDNSARLFEVDTLSFSAINSLPGTRINRNQQYTLKLEARARAY